MERMTQHSKIQNARSVNTRSRLYRPSQYFFCGLRSKFLNLILCQILLQWLSKGFEVTLGHKLDLFVASPGFFGRFALFDPKKILKHVFGNPPKTFRGLEIIEKKSTLNPKNAGTPFS